MKTKKNSKKFIDEQLNEMLEEGKQLSKNVSESKESFASNIAGDVGIGDELLSNNDYFAEAFKKIDADRISEQLEMEEPVETETAQEETIATPDEPIENLEITEQRPVEKSTVSEETKKISFFDRLLELL